MKARYLLVAAAVLLIASAAAGLHYRLAAHDKVAAMVAADTAGQDVSAQQAALKSFVHKHMFTQQTVFLSGSYNRAAQAAQAAANPSSNGSVYAAAQAACASHADSLVQARCVQAYLTAHAQAGANPQAVTTPVKSAYTTTDKAPTWTLDATGVLLLLTFATLAGAAGLLSIGQF